METEIQTCKLSDRKDQIQYYIQYTETDLSCHWVLVTNWLALSPVTQLSNNNLNRMSMQLKLPNS